jgi:hypothetical protein
MNPFEAHSGLSWDMVIFLVEKAERQSQMSVVVYPNDTRRSRRFSGIIMYDVLLFL